MADFDAPKLMLTALAEIELPSRTLRLCDGGFVYVGANKFTSVDQDFGTIESVDALEDRVGDEAPAGALTFLPESIAAAADLSQPGFQGSPLRFYLARVDEATGTAMGDPELVFDGELDTTTLILGRGTRRLDMGFISVAERLWSVNDGNVLSSRFHKSVWPGEAGFDNATGIGGNVSWGVEGPNRGIVQSVGGGGGSSHGSGSGSFVLNFVDQL